MNSPEREVLDAVLYHVRDGDWVVTLHAYFDASGRRSGLFSVAGYAFNKAQLVAFDREWDAIFGPYGGCHMKELTGRNGRFRDISSEEADRLMRGAVDVINGHTSFGTIVSCQVAEIRPLLPKWIKGTGHEYAVCAHVAMTVLGSQLEKAGADRVAYFFESGDDGAADAAVMMSYVAKVPELKELYRHRSHAVIDKQDALALQAADVLAWEWAKFMDETVIGKKRLMRKSLQNLMSRDGKEPDPRYSGLHLTGEPLASYCKQVEGLGILQRIEDNIARDIASGRY
jgi:hypothetical protein